MAFPLLFSRSAERYSLIQGNIVADDRRLADDNSAAVVYKKPPAYSRAGMDLDPCLARSSLGDPSCPELVSFQIQLM